MPSDCVKRVAFKVNVAQFSIAAGGSHVWHEQAISASLFRDEWSDISTMVAPFEMSKFIAKHTCLRTDRPSMARAYKSHSQPMPCTSIG